jgi:hypothetical protein
MRIKKPARIGGALLLTVAMGVSTLPSANAEVAAPETENTQVTEPQTPSPGDIDNAPAPVNEEQESVSKEEPIQPRPEVLEGQGEALDADSLDLVDISDLPVDPDTSAIDLLMQSDELAPDGGAILTGTSTAEDALVVKQNEFKVEVPKNAEANAVDITAGDAKLGIEMPDSAVSAATPKVVEGTVVYQDGESGTASSVQVLDRQAVRMTVSIPNPEAPLKYDFKLNLGEGMSAQMGPDGGVDVFHSFTGEDGQPVTALVYTVAKPWAKDANKSDVTTWYELNGSTITQHVAPDADTVFPIVADPVTDRQISDKRTAANVAQSAADRHRAEYDAARNREAEFRARANGLSQAARDWRAAAQRWSSEASNALSQRNRQKSRSSAWNTWDSRYRDAVSKRDSANRQADNYTRQASSEASKANAQVTMRDRAYNNWQSKQAEATRLRNEADALARQQKAERDAEAAAEQRARTAAVQADFIAQGKVLSAGTTMFTRYYSRKHAQALKNSIDNLTATLNACTPGKSFSKQEALVTAGKYASNGAEFYGRLRNSSNWQRAGAIGGAVIDGALVVSDWHNGRACAQWLGTFNTATNFTGPVGIGLGVTIDQSMKYAMSSGSAASEVINSLSEGHCYRETYVGSSMGAPVNMAGAWSGTVSGNFRLSNGRVINTAQLTC